MEQIVLHFGQKPDRDAFADASNARFEKWYGPGSVDGEDAFEKDWGEEFLWINPPFNLFNKVLDKIQSDKAHCYFDCTPVEGPGLFEKGLGAGGRLSGVPQGYAYVCA